jgi:hypothetical protein
LDVNPTITMAIITDLPLELVLDIIEYLKPYSSSIGSNENLRYGASILESWHNFKQQASHSEAPASESQTASETPDILEPKEVALQSLTLGTDEASHDEERKPAIDNINSKQYQSYSALRALRQ